MSRKIFLFFLCLSICAVSLAQDSLLGKWKPVSFNMGNMITSDIKAGTAILSDTLKIMFKDDKDPEASLQVMEMMANVMLRKMSNLVMEFFDSGDYSENDVLKNKMTKGSFQYDDNRKSLITITSSISKAYTINFKDQLLILTSELKGKDGDDGVMVVEFERLK